MTTMSPEMDAALQADIATIFAAVEIVLPDYTIRLCDGAGVVSFDGKIFTGQDATYGTLYSVDEIKDGSGDEAPAVTLTLAPASNAAEADISSAAMQGSQVTFWLGVVDPTNGLVVGEPLVVFLGELDIPTLRASDNSLLLDLQISSAFEEFFFNDDGARLSDTFHQSVWPGEKGMSFCVAILHQLYWGSDAPSGVTQ
jgi:hypothetical protein